MSDFSFSKANHKDEAISFFKYINRRKTHSSYEILEMASAIKRNGYIAIPDFFSKEEIDRVQSSVCEKIENGLFDYPVLAQSKIDEKRDKDLIDNFLLGTGKDFQKRGIAFTKENFNSYEQVLKDFQPSTLGFKIPEKEPSFFKLWLDERLLNIIEAYMGFSPYLLEAYVRRNFPSPYRTMNHFWHRDLNNKFHLLKVFIFLSDCDLTNGPHEFVSGSHRDFRLNGKRYYSDTEVDVLHSEKIVRSQVKAGTVIIEDTRGLHRASLPLSGHRDLGYGVFLPIPWYRNYKYKNYQINRNVFDSLTGHQQSYIPKIFIKD